MNHPHIFQPVSEGKNILIANLMYSLDWIRNNTIQFVRKLHQTDLDAELLPSMNTIGTLLAHIAAMECYCRAVSFEGRDFTEAEAIKWDGAFTGQMRKKNITGNSVEHYIALLMQERALTRQQLELQNDSWLFSEVLYPFDVPVNNYYCWFHFMEDEMNHFGQIRMICSNLNQMEKYKYENLRTKTNT